MYLGITNSEKYSEKVHSTNSEKYSIYSDFLHKMYLGIGILECVPPADTKAGTNSGSTL